MALPAVLPEKSETKKQPPPKRKKRNSKHAQTQTRKKQGGQKMQTRDVENKPRKTAASPWDQFKNLLTCKQIEGSRVHDPSKRPESGPYTYPCGSVRSFRDVSHGHTKIVHRAESNSPDSNSVSRLITQKPSQHGSSSRSNGSGSYTSSSSSSSRAMQFRKLSGCYECRMIVDPTRYPISPRICSCSQCGEVFPKLESLELHQAVRHAVSELGPEDSGRNIVEIIFKSSWLKRDGPMCKIERILKVHNTQRTIQRFEDCRDAVKSCAMQSTRKDPRCAADGNELLRFHCTTLTCSLGSHGDSTLCCAGSGPSVSSSVPGCGVCTVIRHGFSPCGSGGGGGNGGRGGSDGGGCGGGSGSCGGGGGDGGVWTTASSGRAHDSVPGLGSRRAMLVCRVIAGRVKGVTAAAEGEEEKELAVAAAAVGGGSGWYDSVAVGKGVYSNLEELMVFNPRAILPCFVVIYKLLES